MPRLGELLVAAGLLTVKQVEQALRAQVLWGGRLGTNLVELHFLELEPLSKVLSRQHQLPAALARHFEKADPDLQRMLSPDVAEQLLCVPLLRMGPERHVVIASLAPLPPKHLAIIAGELAVDVKRLVPAIAPELRIRYQLERVYGIRRAARFLRARGKTIPPFPDFQVLPVPSDSELDLPHPVLPTSTQEMEVFRPRPEVPIPSKAPAARGSMRPITEPAALTRAKPVPKPNAKDDAKPNAKDDAKDEDDTYDDLVPVEAVAQATTDDLDHLSHPRALDDDLAIPTEIEDEVTARQRRKYVRTIADAPPTESERQSMIGKIAIRKIASASMERIMAGASLDEAIRAIRRSTDRDRVGALVLDALERFAPACEAAIMLVVRGATAIGWRGFQRGGGSLGEIAVPMEDGGLVPGAIERNVTLRTPCTELDTIDRLLLASLGRNTGDLVVVPISIATKVICVIAIAAAHNAPLECAEPVAAAAGTAFARLIRNASR